MAQLRTTDEGVVVQTNAGNRIGLLDLTDADTMDVMRDVLEALQCDGTCDYCVVASGAK